MAALVAEILMFELAQASSEHGRARDEHDRQRRLHDEQRGRGPIDA